MRLKYPYSIYRGFYLPIIPLEIFGLQEWHTVWAFVDSGATYSLFGIDVAKRIGLDWRKGQRIEVVVGDGDSLQTYLHPIEIKLSGYPMATTIGFSERLGVGFNLLGRKDFFERFTVCFNEHFRQVTFTRHPVP